MFPPLASENPNRTPQEKGRRTTLIVLAVAIVLLFAVAFSQTAFNLTFLRPTTSEQTLTLMALSALIFLLLLALTFVLVRNVFKLYTERRSGVPGSKFRTKMVLGALLLSLTPVIFLFQFAYLLMNRSIDKWFSRPAVELREDSGRVAALLANYAAENARAEAAAIAGLPETRRAFETGNFSSVIQEFRRHDQTLQGGFALALVDDYAQAAYHAPEAWGTLRPKLAEAQKARAPTPVVLGAREFMIGVAPVGEHGRILVALPLPDDYRATLNRIEESERKYWELSAQRREIRRTYMGVLGLLTVIVLFAATWSALLLSKLVTRPVAALAEATQEISRGRLEHRVAVTAADELGELVTSFNRMAEELESSRRKIESASQELAGANVALEQRRRTMETILESIPTGVLSLDAGRLVTRANPALGRIFAVQTAAGVTERSFQPGAGLRELFPSEVVADLEHQIRKADRMGTVAGQMEMEGGRGRMNLAVTVASMQHAGARLGYVIVFEDLSEMLKAQKQAAWREVARRVAHEIKNPLTPIALSAERIRRHLERGVPPDEASLAVVSGCAETIAGAVETVRTLVDEFSTLASFPASQLQPADVNAIVQSALGLFNGRLDGVTVRTVLAGDLPAVHADANALRRAIANLVDNAAEAVADSLVREVEISTALVGARDSVEIVVADTGPGISADAKEKLFLPYFSTKKRGTGLGLAIVGRIVEEHHGSIRVEENFPIGARFIMELPLAEEPAARPQETQAAPHRA